MRFSRVLKILAVGGIGLLAAGWWTTWLDPVLTQLPHWRQQAQQTSLGQSLAPAPPVSRWVTIGPRSREDCFASTGRELNADYQLCRSGRRELVREGPDGRRTVLEVAPLTEPEGIYRSTDGAEL